MQLFNEFVTSTLTDMCWVWTLVLRLKSTLLNQDTPCCFIFVVFCFFFQEHTRAPLPSLVLSGLSHTIVTVAGTVQDMYRTYVQMQAIRQRCQRIHTKHVAAGVVAVSY